MIHRCVHSLTAFSKKLLDRFPGFNDFLRLLICNRFQSGKKVVKKEFPSPGRCLDLGCGHGILSVAVPSNSYVGVDLSPVILRSAKKKCAGSFLAMRAEALGFQSGSF